MITWTVFVCAMGRGWPRVGYSQRDFGKSPCASENSLLQNVSISRKERVKETLQDGKTAKRKKVSGCRIPYH